MKFGIEQVRQVMFRVIFRRQITFLFRTIRRPTFARIVNPTHDVIVVGFLADTLQVGRKCAAHSTLAFAD